MLNRQEIRHALRRVARLLWAWTPWLSVAALTAALGALLLWGPEQMVQWVGVKPNESYAGMVNEYRRTLTQALTVLGGVLALYFLWRRTKSAEDTLQATRDGKITERFAKAVEQLGALDKDGKNPILEMRFGGIYALERIARESPSDHQPIMEILTAYVRQNAPWQDAVEDEPPPTAEVPELRKDIQAILTVLGRRTREHEQASANSPAQAPFRLDLRCTDLRGARLEGAHLEGVDLEGAHLEGAHLEGAHLEGAFLLGADLEEAHLPEAHLAGALLRGAHLEGAFLPEAHLDGANLYGAHLEKAYLRGAHLEGAYLLGAHLEGAYLLGAHLTNTLLEGVDLAGVRDLTREQLAVAITDGTTILPAYLGDESQAASSGAS